MSKNITTEATTTDTWINIYFFLANIFGSEPTAEFLDQLALPIFENVFQEFGINYKDELWQKSKDDILLELEAEYAHLFLGPGKHISPHESVQRGENRHWGNYTVAVNKFYQRNGYKISDDFKEMPDHLSAELQFLGYLLQEENKFLKQAKQKEVKQVRGQYQLFLEDHLSQWLQEFVVQVNQQANYKFYPAFVELLARFVGNELAAIPVKQ